MRTLGWDFWAVGGLPGDTWVIGLRNRPDHPHRPLPGGGSGKKPECRTALNLGRALSAWFPPEIAVGLILLDSSGPVLNRRPAWCLGVLFAVNSSSTSYMIAQLRAGGWCLAGCRFLLPWPCHRPADRHFAVPAGFSRSGDFTSLPSCGFVRLLLGLAALISSQATRHEDISVKGPVGGSQQRLTRAWGPVRVWGGGDETECSGDWRGTSRCCHRLFPCRHKLDYRIVDESLNQAGLASCDSLSVVFHRRNWSSLPDADAGRQCIRGWPRRGPG